MQIKYIRIKTISFALLVLMLLLTGLAYDYIRKNIQQQGRLKFESQSQAVADAIRGRLERDIYLLYSLRGLYTASKSVERSEFKAFGDGSELSKIFPGIYAIEFVEKISANDRDSFIESVKNDTSIKAEGYPEFKIYPAGDKEDYLVLKYFYPEEEGAASLGFDFATEKKRMAALEKALKADSPMATEKVKLIGDDGDAFSVFLPIYKNDYQFSTEAERKESLSGYVGVVIKIDKFFDSAIQSEKIDWKNWDMYVYDQAPDSHFNTEDYLYDVDKEEVDNDKAEWAYFYDLPLNIAGNSWTLHFVADPDYGINNLEFAMMGVLILFGVALSFFIAGSLYFLGTSRERALNLASEMTRDLRSSEERFRTIFMESKDAMMTILPEKGFISGNQAAIEMFGCRDEKDFISRSPVELSPEYQSDGTLSSSKSQKMMALALEKGSNLFEWTHKRVNDAEFQASVLLSKIEKGDNTYLQATVRDITIQKKAEGELKKHAIEMEKMNRTMVGREIKMIELKKEIETLKKMKPNL